MPTLSLGKVEVAWLVIVYLPNNLLNHEHAYAD